MPSPVFRRLGRVDQDGIGGLSRELSNVFDGGAHVVLLLSFCNVIGVVQFELVVKQNYENNERLLRGDRILKGNE